MNEVIGKPIDRVDGRLKVTGGAPYTAEFNVADLAYAVTLQSTISKGHMRNLDTAVAEKAPGVIGVITYKNSPGLHAISGGSDPSSGKYGEKDLLPLQSERIFYDGQHIAIVVAETFEQAEYAASLIHVEYAEEAPVLSIEDGAADIYKPKQGLGNNQLQVTRGDAKKAFSEAQVTIEETYETPVYHHNAMEPHATIAYWEGKKLVVYDSTQAVLGTRGILSQMLGMDPENIHVISLFIGGGFGSKGFSWPHTTMAAMAAKMMKRPVKLVLNRTQMFTGNGHRSRTIQKIALGCGANGKLAAIRHETTSATSFVEEFVESAGVATKMIYDAPNVEVTQQIVRINRSTPCPARAPGEAPGMYALEVAMDELAYKAGIDPLELRLINYAGKDPGTGKPFSAKHLKECYDKGAAAIGWKDRNPAPRSMREGKYLVGYGMATATYPANRSAGSAKVKMTADGRVVASCCTQDIGTGTYTILAQIVAEAMGVPVKSIKVKLGDSELPKGPNSGGSQTSASAGPPMRAAALTVRSKIIRLAVMDKKSPLFGEDEKAIESGSGRLFLASNPRKGETYAAILQRQKTPAVEAEATTKASTRETQTQEANPAAKQGSAEQQNKDNPFVKEDEGVDRKQYSFHSFGAQFAKVLVDPILGTVHVVKTVSVMDIGTVLNEKTAKNQVMGGVCWALGMALMEGTAYDPQDGRVVTKDLSDYLVPVHADMPEFEVHFIGKKDEIISPIGSRGVGEIGITGMPAAIVNAIYHATGKRIRNLPVTPDKLI